MFDYYGRSRLSDKFLTPCLPSRNNIFLYPTNLAALENAESDVVFSLENEADVMVKNSKLTPFGRFGLVKIGKKYERHTGLWTVEVHHNALTPKCVEVLSKSLVWSLKHRALAIGETLKYWREFIDYADKQEELDAQCMDLLKKISVMDHPDLAQIVNDAIMIRMVKPVVAPPPRWPW